MVSEHSRYLRDQKSKGDKQQGRFDDHGWLKSPEQPKIEQTWTVNPNELVMCPFCLYQAQLKQFFVSTKKGISQGKALCPECKNGMLMKTLLADMTVEDYATFVFGYRVSGYWQKCPFEVWKKRLKAIGWSYRFWAKYKELKGDLGIDETLDGSGKSAQYYEDEAEAYDNDMDAREKAKAEFERVQAEHDRSQDV